MTLIKYLKFPCDFSRTLCRSAILSGKIPIDLKGRKKSSQEWLIRQLKDPYVEKSKSENYRCRSAFKLLEIDSKFKILHPGQVVVDCGAAPGSWTQVAVAKTNSDFKDKSKPKGFVIGVDKRGIHPINGAILLGGRDFTSDSTQLALREHLGDMKADVVLSDMAPNASGVKTMDHDVIINLAYAFFRFATQINVKGGTLLVKLFEGGSKKTFEKHVSELYDHVRWVKPAASRSDSSEIFLLAREFKGLM